ncbi:UNKNOWN [Stylonychia lemnae]|uniref:Uncharacterized protein n=1 Tax=Stylonychia lemnae TaxID=5949 RepID=A0A077ZYQ3_STYLE|nr:UNKNOWN [Stylonychia lemnae]|eukprot:CDW75081.1 UNKNOWN [Stylonychia lemnae]
MNKTIVTLAVCTLVSIASANQVLATVQSKYNSILTTSIEREQNQVDYESPQSFASQIMAEKLGGDYLDLYNFIKGFLDGSSFELNAKCQNAIDDLSYNGLLLVSLLQNYKVKNSAQITTVNGKFSEATSRFSSKCDFKHSSKIFAELSTLTALPWIRMAARTLGYLIIDFWVDLAQIKKNITNKNFRMLGKAFGKMFKRLFDSPL